MPPRRVPLLYRMGDITHLLVIRPESSGFNTNVFLIFSAVKPRHARKPAPILGLRQSDGVLTWPARQLLSTRRIGRDDAQGEEQEPDGGLL